MCVCMHLSHNSMLLWEYFFRTVNMHSNAVILVNRSDWTNGKSLLMSGQRCIYITFIWHFSYINYKWSLKIVPSLLWHLVVVSCQDFLGHTEGVPFHTAICLIVVIQQCCSGTSELSNLPTSSGWLAVEKAGTLCVLVYVCGEKGVCVNHCFVWLVALYCLCCQKKTLQVPNNIWD